MNNGKVLLVRISEGYKTAFSELYLFYAPKLEAFATALLKNKVDAEDLVHDIFVKLWDKRASLPHIRSWNNYLYTMARNSLFEIFSHREVRRSYLSRQQSQNGLTVRDPLDTLSDKDVLDYIYLCINNMPETRRRIFIANRVEGKT